MPGLRFRPRHLFDQRYLPWIALVTLALILLVYRYVHSPIWRDSLNALLDANFIAAFLAMTVDPILKQSLLKEGAKSIFRYAYGYNLPPELQDFFDANIAGAKFIRMDCVLQWGIKPIAEVKDRVFVPLHAAFSVLNFTDEERNYTHKAFAINATPGENATVESLYCYDLRTNTPVYEYSHDQLQKVPRGDQQQDLRKGDVVRVPVLEEGQKPTHRFGVFYNANQSLPFGLDYFNFSELTANVEVIVTVDEAFKEYIFSVAPSPSDGKVQDENQKPAYHIPSQEWRCYWKFDRVFVPNEMLSIRWQLKPSSPPPATGSFAAAAKARHTGSQAG